MANPDLTEEQLERLRKPAKGSALLDRRDKRAQIKAHEATEKAKVVKRDGLKACRLVPTCQEREKFETAHLDDKGMGGDHGNRTSADRMIRSCFFHHQGPWSLHSNDLRVDCLTPEGTDGPVEVWARDEHQQWYLLKRETAVNVVERD
jgi:hypothetical protein